MTTEIDSATRKAVFVIGRAIQADLLTHYAHESEETREKAMSQILSLGAAALDTSGRVVYSPAVREIAPRLCAIDDRSSGDPDTDKLMRAAEIIRRRQPLARGSGSMAAARAALLALDPLPANAPEEARLQRASEIVKLMQDGGHTEPDPNGY